MADNHQELFDAIAGEPQDQVDLTVIRQKAVELRDSYLLKAELEERLNKLNESIKNIERKQLTDLFTLAKISSVTVEPDGNHPGFYAERTTVYTAKIPDDRRLEAFQWFEQQGYGDLVKSIINIQFGMQEHEERLRVMKILKDHGVEYYTNESIHHSTLKAFVKREIQSNHVLPHDLLGIYVFEEVKIK